MNKNLTQIAVVLDRSGSMKAIVKETCDNFNEFVDQQRETPGQARLKLVQFNDTVQSQYDKNIGEVEKLSSTTFYPHGMTALFDGIGRTIDDLGESFAAMEESKRPAKVIVLILTDGQENASRKYTQERIAQMIQHQREKYAWEFVFLGANQDDILVAKQLNISHNAFFCGSIADPSVTAGLSRYTSTYRTSGAVPQQEPQEVIAQP